MFDTAQRAAMNRRSSPPHWVWASTPKPTLSNLDALIDDRAVAEAFDQNPVGLAGREGRDAPAAFRAPRCPRDSDAPHGLAARQGVADEQVDMRLKKPARAELEHGEFGHDLNLDERFDDAGFGFDPGESCRARLRARRGA